MDLEKTVSELSLMYCDYLTGKKKKWERFRRLIAEAQAAGTLPAKIGYELDD